MSSVLKGDRNQSQMDFLAVARDLQKHTITKCVNFPKRYTFYVSEPLAKLATEIYQQVKRGNSIYPTNQHEAQMRRDCFLMAKAMLYDFVSQLEVAKEVIAEFDSEALKYWMQIVKREIGLIDGVLKNDRKRYKQLPGVDQSDVTIRFMKAVVTELREIKELLNGNHAE